MLCSISGHSPKEPVVSKTSGLVFEKELILKHLEQESTCPVTGEALSKEDLIALQVPLITSPQPLAATSIPGLLSMMQTEWDSLMLESFKVKKKLESTQQELSLSLYQYDAACRTIARLLRERDEARGALGSLRPTNGSLKRGRGGMDEEEEEEEKERKSSSMKEEEEEESQSKKRPRSQEKEEGRLSEDVMQILNGTWKTLSEQRKGKKHRPDSLVQKEQLSSFSLTSSWSAHKTRKPAVNALSYADQLVASAGVDKEVVLFDIQKDQILTRLTGHTKAVTDLCFASRSSRDLLASGSMDKTVRVWRNTGRRGEEEGEGASFVEAGLFECSEAVSSLSFHPSSQLLLFAQTGGLFQFADLNSSSVLSTFSPPSSSSSSSSSSAVVEFHPDGMLLFSGCDQSLLLWDIKNPTSPIQSFSTPSPLTTLSFSENGYSVATGHENGDVMFWDLRKLKTIKTLSAGESESGAVRSVSFEEGGSFLAYGRGKGVYATCLKEWTSRLSVPEAVEDEEVSAVCWGEEGKHLFVGSSDRQIKHYALQG